MILDGVKSLLGITTKKDLLKQIIENTAARNADTAATTMNTEATNANTEADARNAAALAALAEANGVAAASEETEAVAVTGLSASFKKLGASISATTGAVVTFLATNPIGWAILVAGGIALGIKALSDFETAMDDSIQKVKETRAELNNSLTDVKSKISTVSELAKRYDELSKSVSSNGNNILLSNDEYNEFLDISNKLGGIFPDLISNYDELGNAILKAGTNLETLNKESDKLLVSSYNDIINSLDETFKAQDELSGNWFVKNSAFLTNDNKNELVKLLSETNSKEEFNLALNEYYKNHNTAPASGKMIENYLDDMGIEVKWNPFESSIFLDTDLDFSSIRSNLVNGMNEVEDVYKEVYDSFRSGLNAYFKRDNILNEANIPENLESIGVELIEGLSNEAIKSMGDTKEDFENFTKDLTVILTDGNLSGTFMSLFELNAADMPISQAESALDSYISKISEYLKQYDEENGTNLWNLLFPVISEKDDEVQSAQWKLKSALEKTGGYITAKSHNSITKEESDALEKLNSFTPNELDGFLDYFNTLEDTASITYVELWNGWQEYNKKIKESITLEDFFSDNSSLDSSKTWGEITDSFESGIDELQDLLDKLKSGDTTIDIADIIKVTSDKDAIFSKLSMDDFQTYIDSYNGDLSLAINAYINDALSKLQEAYEDTGIAGDTLAQAMENIRRIANEGLGGSNDLEKRKESYEELVAIYERINNGESLSTEETAILIDKYGDLADAVKITADGYSIEKEALVDIINSHVDLSNEAIAAEIATTKDTIEQIKARIKARSIEAEALSKHEESYSSYRSGISDDNGIIDSMGNSISDRKELQAQEDYLERLNELFDEYQENSRKWENEKGSLTNPDNYDWIETKLSRIQRIIDNIGKTVSNTFNSWKTRKNGITKEISELTKLENAQRKAADKYKEKAESINLSAEWKEKIRNGAYSIDTVTDEELSKAIEKYKEYWEKYLEASDAAEDALIERQQKIREEFDTIGEEYDSKIGVMDAKNNLLQSRADLQETQGHLVSAKYYAAMKSQAEAIAKARADEYNAQLAKFNERLNDGTLEKDTEEYNTWLTTLYDSKSAYEEARKGVVEYSNQLEELRKTIHSLKMEAIQDIADENNFWIDLMGEQDMFDEDTVGITKYGTATQALHAVNYKTYKNEVNEIQKEIDRVNKLLQGDPNNQEYIKYRKELIESQREAINNAIQEKQAMIDLAQEGYDTLISSLNELVDKYKDALSAQSDLYNYERSIADKTKSVSTYQKQLAAYAGDNSEEAKAKIQQLQVSLEEAQRDLAETEYEKFISDQEDLLDKLVQDTQDWADGKIDELKETFDTWVLTWDDNSKQVSETLAELSANTSIGLSDTLTRIFGGENDSIFGKEGTLITTLKDIIAAIENQVKNSDNEANTDIGLGSINETNNGNSGNNTGNSNSGNNGGNSGESSGDKTLKSSDVKVGTKVKFDSGKYHSNEYGGLTGASNLGKSVYVTKIADKGDYKYHISTGKKLGDGDLGWLKLDQLKGYSKGSRRINKDELAWTQEKGQELIYRASDGAMLTPLGNDDKVFTAQMSDNLWNLAQMPSYAAKVPVVNTSSKASNASIDNINIAFNLPNVKNYEEFKQCIKTDTQLQKTIQDITLGSLRNGNNSLGVLRR